MNLVVVRASIGHSPDVVGHTGPVDSPRDSHVTILLSTFDGEEWLPDLYASICQQTHTDWTLRVRDDGSRDGTVDFLKRTAAADTRVELVADDLGNLGPAASFMALLATVDHGLFAFCDQDDVWLPHKLDASIEALVDRPVAGVYTDAEVTDAAGAVTSRSALTDRGLRLDGSAPSVPLGHLLINNVAIGATVLGTAALASRAVTLSDDRPVHMHDWWVAMVAAYEGDLACLPVATIRWRRHRATVTGARPDSWRERAARRRAYVRWSVDAAHRLSKGTAVSPESERPVSALARLNPDQVTLRGLLGAWRRGGVRAWPLAGQGSLLFSVGVGQMHY